MSYAVLFCPVLRCFAAHAASQTKASSVLVTLADNMKCNAVCCIVLFYAVLFYPTIDSSCCLQMLPVCFVGIHSARDIRNLRCFVVLCYMLYCYVKCCTLLLCATLCFVTYATYRMDTFCFLCYVLPCWLKIITFQSQSQPLLHVPNQRAQISFPVPRHQLPD